MHVSPCMRRHLSLSLRFRLVPSGRVRVELAREMDLATTPMVVSVIDAVLRVHRPSVVELDLTSLSFLSCCAVTALVKPVTGVRRDAGWR